MKEQSSCEIYGYGDDPLCLVLVGVADRHQLKVTADKPCQRDKVRPILLRVKECSLYSSGVHSSAIS